MQIDKTSLKRTKFLFYLTTKLDIFIFVLLHLFTHILQMKNKLTPYEFWESIGRPTKVVNKSNDNMLKSNYN